MQKVLFVHSLYIQSTLLILKNKQNKQKDHLIFSTPIWMNKWKAHLISGWRAGLKGYIQHTLKVAANTGNVNISSANGKWSYTCYSVL